MKKRVMLIDDEAAIRDLLGRFLTVAGYEVTAVPTAGEALKLIGQTPPDIVVTDLQLEESDGLELIREIRASLPDLPVILLTGVLFDPDVVRKNIGKMVSAYIEKTASLKRVQEEIERLIGK